MSGFCATCGGALKADQRFCPGCGSPVLLAATPPIEANPAPTGPSGKMSPQTRSLLLGAGVAAAIGAVVSLGMFFSRDDSDPALSQPVAATAAATEDPNAPRPQAWFDNYQDKFLSAELERLVTGSAQKRSFPTAKGGSVLGPVTRGELLKGRWVEGGDPKTRWLKTADGGYVWEGNLGDPLQISSLGMNGFVAGSRYNSVSSKLRIDDEYGTGSAMDQDGCEIFASDDGLSYLMFSGGKVTRIETDSERLETASGIHVGSSEKELLRAYPGSKLKREVNDYGGFDYFYWASKDRGIKFHVDEGKVTSITAGDETIRYIEGCA